MLVSATGPTVDQDEVARFAALAQKWWDTKGEFAPLHALNPVRLGFIRDRLCARHGRDPAAQRPLEGLRLIDVGCGGGLLCEPLARLGARVTGIDPAPESIAAARAHAEGQALAIAYRTGSVEALGDDRFDLVVSMEVIEHVTDPAAYVRALAGALAPGGLMILSTPNRTALSRLLLVGAAEATGMIPRGTHDWAKFLMPDELTALLGAAGLAVSDVTGLAFSPARGLTLGADTKLNYLLTATAA